MHSKYESNPGCFSRCWFFNAFMSFMTFTTRDTKSVSKVDYGDQKGFLIDIYSKTVNIA